MSLEANQDAVLPIMKTLQRMPNDVLVSYKARAQLDSLQGKSNVKSGRYNSVLLLSHWPSGGFQDSIGKKRALYGVLSMPQWMAGQLTNIYNILDHSLAKQALLQVIYSIKYATSLPWAPVRYKRAP